MPEFESSTGPVISLTPRQATFHGTGAALFGIYLRNILLTLLTIGIYYFWGKNRLRAYLAGQCEFEGDRFAWHGTGRELFLGASKALVILTPLAILVFVVPLVWKGPAASVLARGLTLVWYFVLGPLVAVGARRYRMSRLSWRGIRFSFRGRLRDFFKLFLRGSVLTSLTLGLYTPYFQAQTRKFFSEHTYFGNVRFGFDGRGGDLIGRFLAVCAVSIVAFVGAGYALLGTIGLRRSFLAQNDAARAFLLARMLVPLLLAAAIAVVAWFWYAASRQRYYWSRTSFGTARFRSTMTAGKLLWLSFSNLALVVVTVGLGLPWVIARNARFGLANIAVVGSLDLDKILQEAQTAGVTVEGLADVLGLDLLGVDFPF